MIKRRKIKPEPLLMVSTIREWKILREFPDYEISNDGRLRRATAGSNTKVGASIRANLNKYGYPQYGLTARNGVRFYRSAHRLVASEFLKEPAPGKTDVLHHDDNKLNCLHTNLKWGSDKDNWEDSKRNGRAALGMNHPSRKKPWTRPRGEKHSSSKLTENDVRNIVVDKRNGPQIAKAYGVDSALIYRIKKGEIWKHITNPEYCQMLEAGAARDR